MITDFTVAGINCHIYIDGNPKAAFYWGTASGHTDIEQTLALIKKSGGRDYLLCAYEAQDWNRDYSPWPAPPVFGKESFGGQGKETLAFLNEQLRPHVEEQYPKAAQSIIAGYSLAGLFSLWAALNSSFDGAISCSGSLWYPNWLTYLQQTTISAQAKYFYLSLGDKESKTKNKIMATVGENTQQTAAYLSAKANCHFEWNQGGHFQNSEERMAKGIMYMLEHIPSGAK